MGDLLIYLRFVVREGLVPRSRWLRAEEAEAGLQAM